MESELPKGWKSYKLGDIAEYINGRAFKPSDWGTKGLPIIRIQNLKDADKPFNYYAGVFEKKNEVNKGDILFSWSGTIGTSFGAFKWGRRKAILNQHIFRVEVNEKIVTPDFFVYLLNFFLDKINQEAHGGVGLGHITKASLVKIEVPIPPISSQNQIVAKLDAFFKEYDILKKEKEKAKENYEKILQSAIDKLFFPEILPKHWKIASVKDVCSLIQYGFTAKSVKEATGVIYLRITDIDSQGNLNNDFRYVEVSKEDFDKFKLEKGDIVIARTGATVGKSYLVSEKYKKMIFASYLIRFRANKEKILSEFLHLQFNSLKYWTSILREQVGIGQPNVNATKLGDFEICYPENLQEQETIIKKARVLYDTASVIRAESTKIDKNLEALHHSVLSKAFKGELV